MKKIESCLEKYIGDHFENFLVFTLFFRNKFETLATLARRECSSASTTSVVVRLENVLVELYTLLS